MNMEAKIPAGTRVPAVAKTRRKFFRLIFPLALLLFAAAGVYFWAYPSKSAEQYVTAPATVGNVTRIVAGSGTVNPVLTVIVGTYVSGVIQNISCDFNTRVKKGQLCAKIDPGPYQTVVDQAAANLATAQAQLVKDQANLVYTESVDVRDAKLLRIGGISQQQADVDRSAYEQAKAQIVFDQASIKQRDAALRAAQVNLNYTNII